MKAIIIEDEKAAVRNLKALLEEVAPEMEIVAVCDSIVDTIAWFRTNPSPELVFMDIHLADGSAFEIFEHTIIDSPIIFTTAYDEYALKAFKVNSIDYLLKPIGEKDLKNALAKFDRLTGESQNKTLGIDYKKFSRAMKEEDNYKSHFLIPVKGDKLLPVAVEMVACFYIQDGIVKMMLNDSTEYPFPQTLDEVTDSLDPSVFFRVNRQYLIARKSVKDIDLWFNGRLAVNLKVPTKEKILVSKARVGEFKDWFTKRL